LNVVPLRVPSLNERRGDIPLLIHCFLDSATAMSGLVPRKLASDALAVLQTCDWPGNVRELMHVIERAVLTAKGGRLRFELPGGTREPAPEREATTREVLTEAELQRSHDNNLRAALEQTGWKIYGPGGTAELLGMKPTTLTARIKKAGLRKPDR